MFDWNGTPRGRGEGGPLFVPRRHQGAGRHDAPHAYAAWYCAQHPTAAIAERIHHLRGQTLTNDDFKRVDGTSLALVGLRVEPSLALIDLDDPAQLVARGLRPSHVASRQRVVTQKIAENIFDEGAAGLLWWSTLDADWINVTLFHERVLPHVTITIAPRRLVTQMPEVRQAAERLGVRI